MGQLRTGFCTLHAGVTLKCVGPSLGEKQPLTKKLPATTTVSTCWYYIAILIYRVVGTTWEVLVVYCSAMTVGHDFLIFIRAIS